jgi:hypothetical protein
VLRAGRRPDDVLGVLDVLDVLRRGREPEDLREGAAVPLVALVW